jgi:hypothetical protein
VRGFEPGGYGAAGSAEYGSAGVGRAIFLADMVSSPFSQEQTTLEIPDPVFRRAKSVAAQRGIPLRAFVTEAVEEKLAASLKREEKPWVRLAGGLKHLNTETVCINQE